MADDLDGIEDLLTVQLCDGCISNAHPGGNDLFEHPKHGLMSCDCSCHPVNKDDID